jgi:hypothetical protein
MATKVAQMLLAPRSLSSVSMRFWIETIALVSAIACALTLLIATFGVVAAAAVQPESDQPRPSAAVQLQTYEGVITDTQCGAKHSAAIGKTAADCTRVCVHGGAQFALIDGDTIYQLDGELAVLKRVAGQRVRVFGMLNGNRLSVTSVAVAT